MSILTTSSDWAPGCESAPEAARHARLAGLKLYRLSRNQRRLLSFLFIALVGLLALLIWGAFCGTFTNPESEPFGLFSGVSIWPTEFLRWLAFGLALVFIARTHECIQKGIINIIREYRLPFNPPEKHGKLRWFLSTAPVPQTAIRVSDLWLRYQQLHHLRDRFCRTILPFAIYFLFASGIFLINKPPSPPLRGTQASVLDSLTLWLSIIGFLLLTFWILDAVRLGRLLVEQLSEAYTEYPGACLEYFARRRGIEPDDRLLEEWLDLRLIADLTENLNRLVYYPFLVLFFIAMARSQLWDRWSWPPSLVIVFGLNLLLVIGGVVMLQRAAHRAREIGLARLRTKVERETKKTKTPAEHKSDLGEKLVEEIQSLRKGAFVPFWENPLVGAILLPSGGTALIELFLYILR